MNLVATERVERKAKRPTADPAWLRAAFLAPAVVGAVAALAVIGQTAGVRRSVRRWLGRDRTPAELDRLRASVVGQKSRRVQALFGPPPASTSAPTVTWYYPVESPARVAMAISFEDDRATRVDFLPPPA